MRKPDSATAASPSRSTLQGKPKLQLGVVGGIALAIFGVYSAMFLQGGSWGDLVQWSPLVLLLTGTGGALLVTTPLETLREAAASAAAMLAVRNIDTASALSLIASLAKKAKRGGVAVLEEEIEDIDNPLLAAAIRMAADGSTDAEVTGMMRLQMRLTARRVDREARVFEAAGGYAPTLGILGAVMGLIQVMKHLDQMAAVGHGIAASFASTVYGLALANLVLLPIAGRLRAAGARRLEADELLLEGVVCVMEKLHPLMIESRLSPFVVPAPANASTPRPQRRETPTMILAKGA